MNDTHLQEKVEVIVSDFVSASRDVGCHLPSVPTVEVRNTPGLIFIRDGVVTVPSWSDCGADVIRTFEEWATAACGDCTGERFFRETFNWLLIAHELGHFVQRFQGRKLSHWDSEVDANMIAVAYWQTKGAAERLQTVIEWAERIGASLPDPVPEGEDPVAFFNSNYAKLGQNPNAYGYFQFSFFKEAYDRDPLFTELVTTTD